MSRLLRRSVESERGSALVLSLLVSLLLLLLVLGLGALADTDGHQAKLHAERLQADALARSGVEVVLAMFRDPEGPLLPQRGIDWTTEAELQAIGLHRSPRDHVGVRYEGNAGRLLAGPFLDDWSRVFAGTPEEPDLVFECLDADGEPLVEGCWLDEEINALLLGDPSLGTARGRISRIALSAPPVRDGQMYGIATVEVEAERRVGAGVTVATVVAIVGSQDQEPTMLVDGTLELEASIDACGDGCLWLHANEDAVFGGAATLNGGDPTLSVAGALDVSSHLLGEPPPEENAEQVEPPQVNPWDLRYKPTTTARLDKYFLFASREPHPFWTDGDPDTVTPSYACGLSECQDYGLSYAAGPTGEHLLTERDREPIASIYQWDEARQNWDLLQTVPSGSSFDFLGHDFRYDFRPDTDLSLLLDAEGRTVDADEADPPFNKARLPSTTFKTQSSLRPEDLDDPIQGVTLLVDGAFWIGSSAGGGCEESDPPWFVSIVADGSVYLGSQSELQAALENRVLIVSGRDFLAGAALNNSCWQGFCDDPDDLPAPGMTALPVIIAVHEQFRIDAGNEFVGIVVVENEVDFDTGRVLSGFKTPDTLRHAPLSFGGSTRYAYECDSLDWPFPSPTRPRLLGISSTIR